jgi:SAM-dependent methyltransferase
MMTFRLFEDFAHRYDLHTPAQHYRHDHAFVMETLATAGTGRRRVLDVGCGTGVFLAKAMAAGFDARGIDPAEGMIAEAAAKVGAACVSRVAMEALAEVESYDGLCALSWVINYAADPSAAAAILRRMHRALVPGGRLILQCAHAPNMTGEVLEDREPGPDGRPDDVVFLFQFIATGADQAVARYVFAGKSLGELLWEEHPLAVADARLMGRLMAEAGFTDVRVLDSWCGDPLDTSASAWVIGDRKRV